MKLYSIKKSYKRNLLIYIIVIISTLYKYDVIQVETKIKILLYYFLENHMSVDPHLNSLIYLHYTPIIVLKHSCII